MSAEDGAQSSGASNLGSIVLARHGKPRVRRRGWSGHGGFNIWWRSYEESGLNPDSKPPKELVEVAHEADRLFSSPMPRAQETMAAISQVREPIISDLFMEAPLPAPPLPVYLPINFWWVMARIYWSLGYKGDFENKVDTNIRADEAADFVIAEAAKGNVLVTAHGWFNRMIGKRLRARGWKVDYDGGDSYWSWRKYLPPEDTN